MVKMGSPHRQCAICLCRIRRWKFFPSQRVLCDILSFFPNRAPQAEPLRFCLNRSASMVTESPRPLLQQVEWCHDCMSRLCRVTKYTSLVRNGKTQENPISGRNTNPGDQNYIIFSPFIFVYSLFFVFNILS